MNIRNLFLVSACVVAILYLWPSQTVKVAKKIGDTTISAVKAGASEVGK